MGRDEDRVDIVFLSEAYLDTQRDLFFDDVARLIEDVFFGPDAPFLSLSPFISIHALFQPSDREGVPSVGFGPANRARHQQLRGRSSSTAFRC